jgi:hypothetical protein
MGQDEKGRLVRGVERSLEIRLGSLGGLELRPTRCFLWTGEEREGRERILSLGIPPRGLVVPRRERELHAGPVTVRSLGNPLFTVGLAAAHAVRRLREERRELPPSAP